MAGNVQGLTVIINGDATPLTKAMRQARAEAGTLRSHLTAVGRALKIDPTSTALLTRQQQLLNRAYAQTAERLATLRAAHSQLEAKVGTMTQAELRQFQALQREITQTELRMAELRSQMISSGSAASVGAQRAAAGFQKVSTTLSRVSTQLMTVSAVAALVGYAAVKASYDFESSFAGVRKTIIATEAEYEQLARASRDLALVKPVDVNDINRIMELGGQLNIATQYLTKFAGVMADLDVSTDMNIEEGSLKLAQFMNITNMAQGDVDRLGATIVDLGNNSATTEDRMMNMAMRIAGTGRNIGMTAQDVLGLAASLSAVGIQAEMGGNAISTIMNRIDKDVATNSDTLSTWASTAGMSASEFKSAWETDVTSALLAVIKGMGSFRDEGNNLNLLLKDMGISYMRQVDTMQRLSRAGSLTEQLIARANIAWQQNTALVREATQRYDTAASRTKMMTNALNEVGITIGNEVLPYFSDFVTGAANFLQAFAKMDAGTKSFILSMTAMLAIAGPAVKAIQLFAGAGAAVIRTFNSLKTAIVLATAGKLSYTNMTIASSAATAQETAAKAANLAATAAQQRAYAALARAQAESAAAMGNSALAAQFDAAAKSVDAMATGTEAAAEEASAVATVGNAGSKTMLATVTEFLTAQTMGLAVALGISNGMLLASVAAIGVLAIGTAVLAKGIADARDPLNKLTASAAEQEEKISELSAAYDEAVAANGANSEEAWAAKAALDAEKASFENSNISVREFNENIKKASEEQQEMAANARKSISEAEGEAGAIINLCDEIENLSATAKDNADDMQNMQAKIAELNMLVPELELYYDNATGTLQSTAGAWREVATEAGKAAVAEKNVSAASDAYAQRKTLADNLAEAEANLARQNLSAADAIEILNQHRMREMEYGYDAVTAEVELAMAFEAANEAYQENENNIKGYERAIREAANSSMAFDDALGKVATGQMTMAEAAAYASDMYGVEMTESALYAEQLRRQAEAQNDAATSINGLVSSIEEAREKHSSFATAMDESGVSAENLAQKLMESGITAEEFAAAVEDSVNKATDGFNRLDTDSSISLEEFMDNLEHNRDAMNNWADNLEYLYSVAGDDSAKIKFVDYLRSEGVENAGEIIQELADDARDGGDAFGEYASEYGDAVTSIEEDSLRAYGVVTDKKPIQDAISNWDQLKAELPDKFKAAGDAAVEAYANALAQGKEPTEAASAMANSVVESLKAEGMSDEAGQALMQAYNDAIAAGNSPEVALAKALDTASKLNASGKAQSSGNATMGAFEARIRASGAPGIAAGIGSSTGSSLNASGRASQSGSATMSGYESGLRNNNAAGVAAGVASGVSSNLGNIDSYSKGYWAMVGLRDGINDYAHLAESAARRVADSVSSGLSIALQVRSPSRVTRRIGRYVSEGLAIGILDGMREVEGASDVLARAATPEASAIASEFSRSGTSSALSAIAAQATAGNANAVIAAQMLIDYIDKNLGPTIRDNAPTATPREFGRMVNEVVNNG